MTADHAIDRYLARYPLLAVLTYVGAVLVLVFIAWGAVADIGERYRTLDAAAEMLARLEGRSPLTRPTADSATAPAPAGSPFLQGQTQTVAGATLLQRVAGAVTRVGGNMLSSQVELEGAQSKNGFISLIASCEMDQAALQSLLYDLEAGMPFLFVDQLVAQAPVTASEGGRTRVLLAVSGLWPGGK